MESEFSRTIPTDSLLLMYDLHTRLFLNLVEGISDKDAHNRLNAKANHIAWLSGSLVQERHQLARELNIDKEQKSHNLFKNHKGIRNGIIYPSLTEFQKEWENISPVLREAFVQATDEQLNRQLPGEDLSFLEAIIFCMDRESYCLGQIGLFRQLLGYEPMR